MASNNFDPGGGNHPPSYSSRVKKNISSYKKLDRNVLIVFIEKKSQEDVLYLNGDQVSNVCALIGLSVTCDTQEVGGRPLLPRPITPKAQYSQGPLLPRPITPTKRE